MGGRRNTIHLSLSLPVAVFVRCAVSGRTNITLLDQFCDRRLHARVLLCAQRFHRKQEAESTWLAGSALADDRAIAPRRSGERHVGAETEFGIRQPSVIESALPPCRQSILDAGVCQ